MQAKQRHAAGVGDLSEEMEFDGLAVVNPLQRHTCSVGTENLLYEIHHGNALVVEFELL